DPVTVTIEITNADPVATDDTATTNEDAATTISVLANDSDPDDVTLTVTGVGTASHGTVSYTSTGVTYTPAANYHGSDSFTYTVSDGHGGTAQGSVEVTVSPVNDAPVASNGSAMTPQNAPVNIDLRTLVSDVETDDDDLTFAVSNAQHGTVTLLGDGHTA